MYTLRARKYNLIDTYTSTLANLSVTIIIELVAWHGNIVCGGGRCKWKHVAYWLTIRYDGFIIKKRPNRCGGGAFKRYLTSATNAERLQVYRNVAIWWTQRRPKRVRRPMHCRDDIDIVHSCRLQSWARNARVDYLPNMGTRTCCEFFIWRVPFARARSLTFSHLSWRWDHERWERENYNWDVTTTTTPLNQYQYD